jgi:hypothetical protein
MSAPLPLDGSNPYSASYQVRQFKAGVQCPELDLSTLTTLNGLASPQSVFTALYSPPVASPSGITAEEQTPLVEETALFATQTVTLTGTVDGTPNWSLPTGGTFTLTAGLYTTGNLAWNITAATTLQTDLRALTSIGSGNAAVVGAAAGPYTVTFSNLSPPPLLSGNGAGLTGPNAPYEVVVQGGQPGIEPF